ncbi:MarR family transcriptional regulator [Nonomuraea sp. NPDC050540]|uniref:MarR family transcriptional regulator n=1 Tax=Nonomuraea sp. NPDC050540 TaxID=3364367 RepID=UPI0037A4E49A
MNDDDQVLAVMPRLAQLGAEQMRLVQPHVTRQVRQLERRGPIRRTGEPGDRRVSFIEPTGEGQAAAELYARSLIGWFAGAIAHRPHQDRADLGRLPARFADDVTAHLPAVTEPAERSPAPDHP